MSRSMCVLMDMEGILHDMQNIERQIDGIDSNVRNRPYTAKELMEERALETEKAEKREQLNGLKQMLSKLLEDKNESDALRTELLGKYQKADNSEERSKYGLYLEWIKEASSVNTKRGQLNRVRNADGQADYALNKIRKDHDDDER